MILHVVPESALMNHITMFYFFYLQFTWALKYLTSSQELIVPFASGSFKKWDEQVQTRKTTPLNIL